MVIFDTKLIIRVINAILQGECNGLANKTAIPYRDANSTTAMGRLV